MRKLVTCPKCNTDQHIYAGKIAKHDEGIIRCTGSGTPIDAFSGKVAPPQRIETGIYQFGEDWPGVYLRGDNAMSYIQAIEIALQLIQPKDSDNVKMITAQLQGLKQLFTAVNLAAPESLRKDYPVTELEEFHKTIKKS